MNYFTLDNFLVHTLCYSLLIITWVVTMHYQVMSDTNTSMMLGPIDSDDIKDT